MHKRQTIFCHVVIFEIRRGVPTRTANELQSRCWGRQYPATLCKPLHRNKVQHEILTFGCKQQPEALVRCPSLEHHSAGWCTYNNACGGILRYLKFEIDP